MEDIREVLKSFDFENQLAEPDRYSDHDVSVYRAIPNSETSLELFKNEDVIEVYGYGDEDNCDGGGEWIYGKLKDGRFFFFSEWYDYTFSGASVTFADSREDIERFGLGRAEREKLGIVLTD